MTLEVSKSWRRTSIFSNNVSSSLIKQRGECFLDSGETIEYSSFQDFEQFFGPTINNLSTPVTKTNGQTMKITYDIIQVED